MSAEHEVTHSPITDHEVHLNTELLHIFSEERRHYEGTVMNVMLLFLTANGALITTMEYVIKMLGPVSLGAIGLVSVLISHFALREPRRQWWRVMDKALDVQAFWKANNVRIAARPFGEVKRERFVSPSGLIHLTLGVFWIGFLIKHRTEVTEVIQLIVH